ncbi:MAG: hypothetical protein ACRDLB_17180, partial [Actinomycetota bacterium]
RGSIPLPGSSEAQRRSGRGSEHASPSIPLPGSSVMSRAETVPFHVRKAPSEVVSLTWNLVNVVVLT